MNSKFCLSLCDPRFHSVNRTGEIRQMFEYGTADNDHDGIAEVLEQLFAGDM